MAIKPITNTQVVNTSTINRAEHRSTKNETGKGGNRSKSIIPGLNSTKNYAITLKDVDTGIISHIKNIMRPTVREAGETIKVPIMYGNEERWKSVRKRGVMRDKNGSFILPLIMLKRTDIAKNVLSGQAFDHDVKRKYADVTRLSRWSKKNRYSNFSVQTGMQPISENIVTSMPEFADITYEFIVWTAYIEQMNDLTEGFINQSNTYWGSGNDYKFLSSIDSVTDATEMDVRGERIIKSTFSLTTKAYLLSEETNSVVTNRISQIQKTYTPMKVMFGYEGEVQGGAAQIENTDTSPNPLKNR